VIRYIAGLAAIIMVLSLPMCVRYDDNLDHYEADVEEYMAEAFMPALDDLEEHTGVQYLVKKDEGVFPRYSLRLIVNYEEQAFAAEKIRLETAYTYLGEPQMSGGDYTMPVTEFSAAGFDFKVAVFENTEFPKCFGMVGISEEKNQIAYLWHYDPDLDYICEADEDRTAKMVEFVEEHFSLK